MPTVNLFVMAGDIKYGGFLNYTAHLLLAFREGGYDASIYKVAEKTERKLRPFVEGQDYQNLSIADALARCKDMTIIACMNWKKEGPEIAALIKRVRAVILHDPTEFNPDLIAEIKKRQTKVIVIRERNRINLGEMGVPSTYIPHPYVPLGRKTSTSRHRLALTLSRVDWDKHTEMIVAANRIMKAKSVDIYGPQNRIFTFQKLDKEFPGWEEYYHGTFDVGRGAAVRLAAAYRYMVDMSAIKGDGDGTQYTFLESMDAGTALVLNAKWFTGAPAKLVPGKNCLAVGTPGELAECLGKTSEEMRISLVETARAILNEHLPEKIIPRYEEALA